MPRHGWTKALTGFWILALGGCMAHENAARLPPARDGLAPAAEEQPHFGTVRFPVTCSAAAQQQFDLAVSELHSFFHPETVKAFSRVLEIDPSCAMAYWGIARSQLPNPLVPPFPPGAYQRGREAIARGKALLPPTQRERDWLEATETYFAGPDEQPYGVRVARYAAAMEELTRRYPDDVEARVFLALALLEGADPHDRRHDQPLRAARLLEGLAPGHPDHPGITHYLIHAYDYGSIAGQGLEAANTYAAIAPSAPHALHMPSHIYSMLGMWKPSLEANGRTLVVARAYAERTFPPGVTYTAEVHSLDFMEYAYLQLGRDREAREVVARAAAVGRTNSPIIAVDAALAAIPVRFALERGAWAEAAALEPRPSAYPYAEAVRLFGRAMGRARMGDPRQLVLARADLDRMKELQASYAGSPDQGYWAEQTAILIAGASAWLALAQGDGEEALRLLREAADLEDASEKHVSMENRLFPMREQLGYLLLATGRERDALVQFEASARSTPGRLRGCYGAAKAAELSGEPGTARAWFEKLRALTADGDGSRPEVVEARAFLAAR